MRFAAVAAVAALASVASAATVNVLVGDQGLLAFNPEKYASIRPFVFPLLIYPLSVAANVGDQIVFTFVQKNHSVIQSSFAAPCAPL
jgi:plastocyanin